MKLPNVFVIVRHGKWFFFISYLISNEEKGSERPGVWSACSCSTILVTLVPWHPAGCAPHWTSLLLFYCLCHVSGSQVNVIVVPFLIKGLVLTVQGYILPCFSNWIVVKCLLSDLFEPNLWKYCVCYGHDKHTSCVENKNLHAIWGWKMILCNFHSR